MKSNIFTTLLLSLICIAFYSCKDKVTGTYMANKPIYQSFEDFRSQSFEIKSPRALKHPGKMWIKDHYLFINETLQGIHIFDNSNTSNPVNLGFIEIYANTDMAVKGDILYADNYNDLLAFNISDPTNPTLECRTNDVFNFQAANNFIGYDSSYPSAGVVWEKGVIIGWLQEEVTEELGGTHTFEDISMFTNDIAFSGAETGGASISSVNVGGSMARFSITGNHLQIIEKRVLTTYNLSTSCPTQTSTTNIWREGETLFKANNNLFIGTTTGMLIYDLSDESSPEFVSDYPHVASCDPVVVSENKAYVTLRTGTRCQGDINELVIIDISNLTAPTEIATYQMTNPFGLGLDESTLFLCDGSDGLKIYDVEDPYALGDNLISHFQNIQTFDVIPWNNSLFMSSAQGIYQFDYSDLQNITQTSLIPVN